LLNDGKVLVAGGRTAGLVVQTAELYDPAQNAWSSAGNMSSYRDEHTATLLPSGKVLIVAGYSENGAVTEYYDPATNSWSPGPKLNTGRFLHTSTLLPNGNLLVAGGLGSNPQVWLSSAELIPAP